MVSRIRLALSLRRSLAAFIAVGSPWVAGTVAGADGSRQPSALELEIGGLHGQQFYDAVKKVAFSSRGCRTFIVLRIRRRSEEQCSIS